MYLCLACVLTENLVFSPWLLLPVLCVGQMGFVATIVTGTREVDQILPVSRNASFVSRIQWTNGGFPCRILSLLFSNVLYRTVPFGVLDLPIRVLCLYVLYCYIFMCLVPPHGIFFMCCLFACIWGST